MEKDKVRKCGKRRGDWKKKACKARGKKKRKKDEERRKERIEIRKRKMSKKMAVTGGR